MPLMRFRNSFCAFSLSWSLPVCYYSSLKDCHVRPLHSPIPGPLPRHRVLVYDRKDVYDETTLTLNRTCLKFSSRSVGTASAPVTGTRMNTRKAAIRKQRKKEPARRTTVSPHSSFPFISGGDVRHEAQLSSLSAWRLISLPASALPNSSNYLFDPWKTPSRSVETQSQHTSLATAYTVNTDTSSISCSDSVDQQGILTAQTRLEQHLFVLALSKVLAEQNRQAQLEDHSTASKRTGDSVEGQPLATPCCLLLTPSLLADKDRSGGTPCHSESGWKGIQLLVHHFSPLCA
ncbi:unnamed protein product [Protopolystoma xenopodis]|uniref:Uncharacterized protein n=1 Tax=Protopolystoma xenopodis TaxID=117903 RepID=A0A448XB74_9PLAT|nr:unnamed protein product [Protopolystoma xenopodis]